MRRVLAIAVRSVWTVVSYIVASLAAGAVVTISTRSMWAFPSFDEFFTAGIMAETAFVIGVSGSILGRAFFLPAMIGITLAEVFSIRGPLPHILGGLAAAAIAGSFTSILDHAHISHVRAWEILLAAGVIAGGVYWLLAGRNSGRWQQVGVAPASHENTAEGS